MASLHVRHNSGIISVPLSETYDGLSFTVRYKQKDWYNMLVATDDLRASEIHIRYKGTEYALSRRYSTDTDGG